MLIIHLGAVVVPSKVSCWSCLVPFFFAPLSCSAPNVGISQKQNRVEEVGIGSCATDLQNKTGWSVVGAAPVCYAALPSVGESVHSG